MKKILINGQFFDREVSGVERYAIELTKALDKICEGMDISILIPGRVEELPCYEHIKVLRSSFHMAWTQCVFGLRARSMGAVPLCLCNEISTLAPAGVAVIHDVAYAEPGGLFPGGKEKDWFVANYKKICRRSRRIITVSEFSKSRICTLFQVPPEKVAVIGNGWQHFDSIQTDETIFEKYPEIQRGKYFFTLASVNRNKNTRWVLETARINPSSQFVLAGKRLDDTVDFSQYPNVKYIGYVKDDISRTLMKHCQAFLFPSLYEGFGIPPMEALCMGAPVIASREASLPEIYGDSVHYIDAKRPKENLEQVLLEPVAEPGQVLERYSWEKSAQKLKELLLSL